MKLGRGDVTTLEGGVYDIGFYRITLDINKQRVYCLKYNWEIELSEVISSDYEGKDKKNISSDQNLNRWTLGLSDKSIFVMKRDESRILMMNKTDNNLFRKITIENSNYYDLIVFNNKLNHTTGE